MNTGGKIMVAGILGTTLMTMYSYLISKKEKEQYREPELLNALIDRSKYLPSIANKKTHPAGWSAHYAIGILFVLSYKMLWEKSLEKPTIGKIIMIGAASGAIGILSWKIFFSEHDNPPSNYRHGYYRQLFFAHIIFSAAAILSYKQFSSGSFLNDDTTHEGFRDLIKRLKAEKH